MSPNRISLDADGRIVEFPEKQAALAWPLPVEVRLEMLLEQARSAGERTSRKELVAALVATCDKTDVQLSEMLRLYRTLKVREILPMPDGQNVVPFEPKKPGPRARR
jgi:hypothetical protein